MSDEVVIPEFAIELGPLEGPFQVIEVLWASPVQLPEEFRLWLDMHIRAYLNQLWEIMDRTEHELINRHDVQNLEGNIRGIFRILRHYEDMYQNEEDTWVLSNNWTRHVPVIWAEN